MWILFAVFAGRRKKNYFLIHIPVTEDCEKAPQIEIEFCFLIWRTYFTCFPATGSHLHAHRFTADVSVWLRVRDVAGCAFAPLVSSLTSGVSPRSAAPATHSHSCGTDPSPTRNNGKHQTRSAEMTQGEFYTGITMTVPPAIRFTDILHHRYGLAEPGTTSTSLPPHPDVTQESRRIWNPHLKRYNAKWPCGKMWIA